VTNQRITLRLAEHPAPSFVAGQRVQGALHRRSPHTVATAARLVSQVIYDLTHTRAVRWVAIDVAARPHGVMIAVFGSGVAPAGGWRVDGLARLLLDRLATRWGEDPEHNRVWFELTGPAACEMWDGAA
jgi:hypothetical protein